MSLCTSLRAQPLDVNFVQASRLVLNLREYSNKDVVRSLGSAALHDTHSRACAPDIEFHEPGVSIVEWVELGERT